MARGSAAWILTIVGVLVFIVGAVLLTVADPIMQGFFASPIADGETQYSTALFGWLENAWTYIGLVILLGLLSVVWIQTRRAG